MNLKDVLRKGDPAAGDPGLSPEEIQAMRRTVLAAVPECRRHGRRGWLIPIIAATAVLVLAAVLALSLWQTAPVEVARQVVPSPPWPPSPASPPPSPGEGGTEKPSPSPKIERVGRRRPLHRNGGEGRGEGGRDQIAQLEPPRQIQFSTPGGTRVIWMLHPAGE
jgi:hypothetical protein